MPTPALQPWDKRRNETPKAFAAFVRYRDAGVSRSLRKLAREGVSPQAQLQEWSARYDWVDRAGAWDTQLDRERQAEQIDELRQMQRRHTVLATQMMQKAIEKIRNIDAERLTVREAVLLADLSVKVERQARGEPTVLVNHSGDVSIDAPSGASILRALKDAPDLLDFAERLDAALAADPVLGLPD
jgi:hypothetical protein